MVELLYIILMKSSDINYNYYMHIIITCHDMIHCIISVLLYFFYMQTWIITDNYSMSRDPTIFEEPLTFNPDRWTRESKKKNAFAHLPFGFGPRACYG